MIFLNLAVIYSSHALRCFSSDYFNHHRNKIAYSGLGARLCVFFHQRLDFAADLELFLVELLLSLVLDAEVDLDGLENLADDLVALALRHFLLVGETVEVHSLLAEEVLQQCVTGHVTLR